METKHPGAWLAVILALATTATGQDAVLDEPQAREMFIQNCARCHGEDGSGTGPAVLDRPARSFMAGGFSFGNTVEAISRTIAAGIPGTPMPAFGESLGEADRQLLAAYVRTLGPPIEEVEFEDTIMVVEDRARVARGILGPIADGVGMNPRGLLVGAPDGFTYEYRTDDVRLLGIRFGGFVRRTDWTGRGGTPLEPLGGVVHLFGDGDPPALFSSNRGEELRARLESTRPLARNEAGTMGARGTDAVVLEYDLIAPDGRRVGQVQELVCGISAGPTRGFLRRFSVLPDEDLQLRFDDAGRGPLTREPLWMARRAEHAYVLSSFRWEGDVTADAGPDGCRLVVDGDSTLPAGDGFPTLGARIDVLIVPAADWLEGDVRDALWEAVP